MMLVVFSNFRLLGICRALFVFLVCLSLMFAETENKQKKVPIGAYLQPALYFVRLSKNKIQCLLCPRECVLSPRQTGYCLIRKNIKGSLYTTNFGNVLLFPSQELDYSTFPLTAIWLPRLDIRGRSGCSLKCDFCYAGETIQTNPESVERTAYYSPEQVIALAKKRKIKIITFTDNEPVINLEYTIAVAKLARQHHMKVILTTAGYVNPEPFAEVLKYVDVVFFSFKGFSNASYGTYTSGDMSVILRNFKQLKEKKIKVEILYVLIPTISDKDEDIRKMAACVRDTLGPYTPVHFIRYMPAYKLKNLPPPSLSAIKKAIALSKEEGLLFVLSYANFGRYDDLDKIIEGDLLTLRCPYCGHIAAQCKMNTEKKMPVLTQDFGENYACRACGKDFLPIFMK